MPIDASLVDKVPHHSMLLEAVQSLSWVEVSLLVSSLLLAFGFEAVNGFHDTANAVATVIYTRAMRPTPAVVWSGLCNMAGIFFGGIGVAFAIVHLLPVDLLINVNSAKGLSMVFALLGAAITWNLGTWYLGLPSSSSHALIGSILGVGAASSYLAGNPVSEGVNFNKVIEVSLALLVSPLLGFTLSVFLQRFVRWVNPSPKLHQAPDLTVPPPFWIRAILFLTCSGVSLAHGSNDGQKGMGLVMLILIGVAPAYFALNVADSDAGRGAIQAVGELSGYLDASVQAMRQEVEPTGLLPVAYVPPRLMEPDSKTLYADFLAREIQRDLADKGNLAEIAKSERWIVREKLMRLDRTLSLLVADTSRAQADRQVLRSFRTRIRRATEYVPLWVIIAVALSLGLGTMVGWQRIVVTVGEKIGKSHLSYSQGASAELVAMSTIGFAALSGLPVSTTHVLSSGVAGTMVANRSGVNQSTLKSIATAWVLTMPATALIAAGLLFLARLF